MKVCQFQHVSHKWLKYCNLYFCGFVSNWNILHVVWEYLFSFFFKLKGNELQRCVYQWQSCFTRNLKPLSSRVASVLPKCLAPHKMQVIWQDLQYTLRKLNLDHFVKFFFSIFISADFGKNVLIMTQVWLVPEALAEGY